MVSNVKRILCVNDDSLVLLVLKQLIKQSGIDCHISTARDGQQALDIFKELKHSNKPSPDYPKLVFLDVRMPVIDGWQFLEEFCKSYSEVFNETKIIVTSFSIGTEDAHKAKNYPCVIDFLNNFVTADYIKNLRSNNFI